MTGVPPQAPTVHMSALVQTLWSLHAVPLATGVGTHMPRASHAPVLHEVIPLVQAVPAGRGTPPQLPLTASHTPISQPTVNAEQSLGVPPMHMPAEHALPTLQRSPVSTQLAPSFMGSGVGAHLPSA